VKIIGRKTKYNKIATEEKLQKVNPKNIALLDEWEIYLRTTGKSPKTIYNYKSDIQIFFVWLMEYRDNKFFVDVKAKDIMFFQNFCLETWGWGPCRMRREKDCLSSLANYVERMCEDEYPQFRNIIRKVDSPGKVAVREKTILTDEDVEIVFDELVANEDYQIACIFALALYSGSRRAELVEFESDFFEKENVVFGSLYKTPKKIKTKGQNGGKYIFKYTLKKPFDRYIYLWKRERRKLGIDDQQYLFVTKDENGKYKQMAESALTYYADKITKILNNHGIDKTFYWHCCRHYFTTHLASSGLPYEVIKDVVGWADLSLVQIYDDRDREDELGKYFNENGIIAQNKKSISDL